MLLFSLRSSRIFASLDDLCYCNTSHTLGRITLGSIPKYRPASLMLPHCATYCRHCAFCSSVYLLFCRGGNPARFLSRRSLLHSAWHALHQLPLPPFVNSLSGFVCPHREHLFVSIVTPFVTPLNWLARKRSRSPLVELQSLSSPVIHTLITHRPASSNLYRLSSRPCSCAWHSRQTNSRLSNEHETVGSLMFSGVRCILWWTISPERYTPRARHRSHRPPTLLMYAARHDRHAGEK